jgi:predicted Fe-Mo cluster-binding NifX family protein
MKICLATSSQGGLDDFVSSNFGRCTSFTIVEYESKEIKEVKVIPNPGINSGSGAGILASKLVVDEGCNVLIAGAIGPNAYQVLSMGNIDVRECAPMPVKEAINAFLEGKLMPSKGTGPGMGRGMGRHGMGMGNGRGYGRGRGLF